MVRTDLTENIVYVKDKDPFNEGLFTQLKISGTVTEYEILVTGLGGGIVIADATTSTKGVVELAMDGENTAGVVVQGNDSRLDDDRFPTPHAYTHKDAGADHIRIDELKKGMDVTTLNTTALEHGLAMKLSGNPLHYYRGDGSWEIPPGAGTIPATESTAGIVELAADGEDAPSVVVQGNDSRLDNARTPTAHAPSHNKDGVDAFAKTDILHAVSRFVETVSGADPTVDTGRLFVNLTDLKYWDNTAGTPVKQTVEIVSRKNAASGYAGLDGSSKVAVANLPDGTTAAKGIVELATDGETNSGVVVQGNDSRLSDARTPTAHKASHESAGGDALHIDTIGAGTDIATNNASTTKHGLLKKLDNNAGHFFDGTGNWSTPPDTGEVNTASNIGTGGVGIWKDKNSLDLRFKKINGGSNKVTVTDDTGNDEVDIDVAQANLSLSSIGGTASWSQVSKTGSVIDDLGDVTITSAAANEAIVRNSGNSAYINALLVNANISGSAAIAYSKLALTGGIVNADVNASAAIAYSKLNLGTSIVNADISASAAIAKSKLASLDVVNADVNASAAIAYSKLNLAGSIVNADVASGAAIAKTKLAALDVVNADVNASAAIAYSKLNLGTSIVNTDVSGSAAIAYSKLNLGTSIVNADIAVGAAIVYSKLALTNAIVDGDINASAAIAWSKVSKTGSSIFDLDDINGAGIADGDVLIWDAGASEFIVGPMAGGPGGSSDLEGLTDVDLTTPAQYHVLQYGAGTDWVNALITNSNIDASAGIAKSKLASLAIVNADVDAAAAIAYSKLNLGTSIVNTDISASAAIAKSKLASLDVVNADVNASAAIAYSKLNLALGIVNADVNASAAIAYSKLNLGTSIVNADISASAAIAYSKLNLALGIVNADISASAAIAKSKLAALAIADADVATHTTTKISTTSKSLLNSAIVYNDQTNSFGDFNQVLRDNRLLINNPADTFAYTIVAAAIAANRNLTLPLLTGNDTMVTEAFAQTLTNKTIAAGSNTMSGIVDANIDAHTTTKITTTAKGQLNSSIVYTDQDNTMGDFNLTLRDNRLLINNPADTFAYTFIAAAIAASRSITLPLLTGNDTMVTEAFTQTLTNKTVNTSDNTLTATSQATGDILKNNGTKFVRMARGTTLQVLRTNSGATDLEWASLNSENAGTAVASGNASTTVFNVAHGLGSTPYMAQIQCSSLTNTFTYTYDSTNIVVTFTVAPPSASNNITFQWRAIL